MSRTPMPRPFAGRTLLTLVHDGGSRRAVTYLGVDQNGRVVINWPTAGPYEVSAKTGRLVGSEKLRKWKLIGSELLAVRRAHRDARARRRAKP